MKFLSLVAAVLALSFTLTTTDAEAARRFGSGKSMGMQRQASVPDKAPTAAPAPANSMAKAPAAAPAAAAAPAKRSWMGPLAGLAAGLGLAALASHFGFGDELASLMMMALLAFAVIAAIGYFMRRKAMASGNGLQYAGASASSQGYNPEPMARNAHEGAFAGGSSAAAPASQSAKIPADFDVAGFARQAKINFIRLQAANDAGNLDDIREFTTPEMFAEIKMIIAERGGAKQTTDVVNINAEVIEVEEQDTRYIASVRFTGLIREEEAANPESIDELWHLAKPRSGNGGWVLAGIQQVH